MRGGDTHGFVDALDLSLTIVARVTSELDSSFLAVPPVAAWSMVLGSLIGATVLSALTYRRARTLAAA